LKIHIDPQTGAILVSAQEISFFARTRKDSRRGKLSFLPVEEAENPQGGKELSLSVTECDIPFTMTGTADLLYRSKAGVTIEKFRQIGRITSRTNPAGDPTFLAEGFLCAYMLCREESLPSVTLRLTYTVHGKEGTASFICTLSETILRQMSETLFSRAAPFISIQADKHLHGFSKLASMAFPYREIRAGQRDFIEDAYRAVKRGSNLLVCAPTGIGKTISALYPALRALGAGYTDKVFYLTAKTVTGNAAAEACRAMSMQVPSLRTISIVSKEKTCLQALGGRGGTWQKQNCYMCPYMGEIQKHSYEERRDAAMLELLQNLHVIDTAALIAAAEKHSLCPYELSLDISEYCEVVICDYNYLFDPMIRFKRYFGTGTGRYAVLLDEAHNLPDRAREMYSAGLTAIDFMRLYKGLDTYFPDQVHLREALAEILRLLQRIAELCRSEEQLDAEGRHVGYYLSARVPEDFSITLQKFVQVGGEVLRQEDDTGAHALLDQTVTQCSNFLRSLDLFDSAFVFYAESIGGGLHVHIRCLDPSKVLRHMMRPVRGAIFFSATLTPMEYFADVLGCPDAPCLELDSPYDPENLGLFGVDSISTRYSDRERFAHEVAEMIWAAAEAKEGNYIVYFPSYAYMKSVYSAFAEIAPHMQTVVQKQGMGHRERDAFLQSFSKNGEAVVGFCVLGGAFSEGVDLRGERLIGTIIVGTGLPKISAEQNLLRDYFEKTRESGFAYAYTYPAMIKVQQAAGRVIRSETDRGVVVLIDDRYAQPQTYKLFPKTWRHIRFVRDAYTLNAALSAFWKKQDRK
jgi:DNA excision repair protein ERCC-2